VSRFCGVLDLPSRCRWCLGFLVRVLYGRGVGLTLTPHGISLQKLYNNGLKDQNQGKAKTKHEALVEIKHLCRLNRGLVGQLGIEECWVSSCRTRVPSKAHCSSVQGVPTSVRGSQGAVFDATILSSRVDVMAVPWVSVAFRLTRVRYHGDSVSQVPLCSVRFLGFLRGSVRFYELVITVWIQSL
jgi:hypothetical protein